MASPLRPAYAARYRRGLQTQGNIFPHCQVREEGWLLVNGRNSHRSRGGGVEPRNRLTFDLDAAGIGLMSARDHLDERGFSGSVLSEQSMHLATVEVERHAPERAHGLERLRDVF